MHIYRVTDGEEKHIGNVNIYLKRYCSGQPSRNWYRVVDMVWYTCVHSFVFHTATILANRPWDITIFFIVYNSPPPSLPHSMLKLGSHRGFFFKFQHWTGVGRGVGDVHAQLSQHFCSGLYQKYLINRLVYLFIYLSIYLYIYWRD